MVPVLRQRELGVRRKRPDAAALCLDQRLADRYRCPVFIGRRGGDRTTIRPFRIWNCKGSHCSRPKKFSIFQSFSYAVRRSTNPLTSSSFLWLQAPATNSIINPYKSTSDRHEKLVYQILCTSRSLKEGRAMRFFEALRSVF